MTGNIHYLDRRLFMGKIGLACGALLCGCASRKINPGPGGCYATAATGYLSGSGVRLSNTSGSAQIDRVLAQEAYRLMETFPIRASFSYFNEPEGFGPNALATPDRLLSNGDDGTVLFGVRFIDVVNWSSATKQRNPEPNPLLPLHLRMVLAHEYSHIFQLKLPRVMQMPTPFRELQADFLAAWHISKYLPKDADRDPNGVILNTLSAFSLYRLGDLEYTNPDHHGNHPQRLVMALEGNAYRTEFPNATPYQAAERALSHLFVRSNRVLIRASRPWFDGSSDLIIGDD